MFVCFIIIKYITITDTTSITGVYINFLLGVSNKFPLGDGEDVAWPLLKYLFDS